MLYENVDAFAALVSQLGSLRPGTIHRFSAKKGSAANARQSAAQRAGPQRYRWLPPTDIGACLFRTDSPPLERRCAQPQGYDSTTP